MGHPAIFRAGEGDREWGTPTIFRAGEGDKEWGTLLSSEQGKVTRNGAPCYLQNRGRRQGMGHPTIFRAGDIPSELYL